jgi:hypothetical protein
MSTPLEAALDAAVARLRLRDALSACAAGLIAAAVGTSLMSLVTSSALATLTVAVGAGAVCAAARYLWLRPGRTRAEAARAIESSHPGMHNLIVTAQELMVFPDRTRPYMRDRVLAAAADRAGSIDPARSVPLGRDRAAAAVGAMVLALVVGVRATRVPVPDRGGTRADAPASAVAAGEFTIDLAAPSYSGRPLVRLRNPAALDALAGSEAVIRVSGGGPPRVRLNGADVVVNDGVGRATLDRSGYLAIDAGSIHRLLPLSVTPDRAPAVRITAPAKDLHLSTTAVSIPIGAEAVDDLALRSFELRYTVVSGTGEQFSFTEGTLPAALTRGSDQSWRLETTLSPATLKLEPGDALIYRAVAADRRPGDAGVAWSDTFFVEIAGPGDVALAGVEMPPDKERHALSQAMIVLKIERLQAREKGMARPALVEAAGTIAAEQRAVRANFIFLLGGEIEDENVEAETSSEIAEGRFANQARQEIVKATVLMGRVEHALTAVSTKEALPLAREAVKALQRAFGHSRYLLRALPSRARLDPARRGTGDLASAVDWNRALAPPASDPRTEAARSALMDLIAVARGLDARGTQERGTEDPAGRAGAPARLARLAERILAMADGAADLQPAAREVLAARDALTAGEDLRARAALQRAAAPLVVRAQRGRIDTRAVPRDPARLAGAAAVLPPEGRRRQ